MANAGSLIPVKSAGCGPLAQGFYNKGLLENEYHMKVGDIVFFNWDNGRTASDYVPFPSVDHVGIVTAVGSSGNFTSVEGNTGSSSNGEVMTRSRNIADVSCVAHPQYNSTFTSSMIIKTAKAEVGTKATNVKKCKYNTWYWGTEVSGSQYDWCAAFVCWIFYHTESSGGGGSSSSTNCIDVSSCQGTIDWAKVAKAGVKYAIMRIGYGDLESQKDSCFEYNYKNAKANGIKVGGYWVCYCGDDPQISDYTKDAELEAKCCLSIIKGKTFDLPIYHDLEVSSVQKSGMTSVTSKFCDTIIAGGYKAGVYASSSYFDAYTDLSTLSKKYSIWIAQWGSTKPSESCDIWQYSETGTMSGISGAVDLDKIYKTSYDNKVLASMKMQCCGGTYTGRVGVIKNIQRILKMCDGYDIDVTGVYDAKTVAAVKRYQKKFGLTQDGICGEKTLKSIFSCE